jgi:hypothetical protein
MVAEADVKPKERNLFRVCVVRTGQGTATAAVNFAACCSQYVRMSLQPLKAICRHFRAVVGYDSNIYSRYLYITSVRVDFLM